MLHLTVERESQLCSVPCCLTQFHSMLASSGPRCFPCGHRSSPRVPPLLPAPVSMMDVDVTSYTSCPQQVFLPSILPQMSTLTSWSKPLAAPVLQATQSPYSHPRQTREGRLNPKAYVDTPSGLSEHFSNGRLTGMSWCWRP